MSYVDYFEYGPDAEKIWYEVELANHWRMNLDAEGNRKLGPRYEGHLVDYEVEVAGASIWDVIDRLNRTLLTYDEEKLPWPRWPSRWARLRWRAFLLVRRVFHPFSTVRSYLWLRGQRKNQVRPL